MVCCGDEFEEYFCDCCGGNTLIIGGRGGIVGVGIVHGDDISFSADGISLEEPGVMGCASSVARIGVVFGRPGEIME